MRFKSFALFLLLFIQPAASQLTFRVMTYNLLQYYPSSGYSRDPYFRTVVQSVSPEILVVQEIDTAAAVLNFLTNVLNAGGHNAYSAGLFIDGSFDSENAIFFRSGDFEFIENKPIKTALRDINQFTLRHLASDQLFTIFSVHLKAGRDPAVYPYEADSVRRGMEVDSLRKVTNALPAGTNFIVLGDFNIYHSFEPAYEKLIAVDAGNEGHFVDPLTMPGVWNAPGYAQYHTQSPRVRSFGYGATGGLDDRFDMILMSKAVSETGGIYLVPDLYRAFGNDGMHYNDSINSRPNAVVADSVADALHAASDHLPVVAEFAFDPAVSVERNSIPGESSLFPNYPNPFNPETAISFQLPAYAGTAFRRVRLSVLDLLGREIAVLVDEERGPGVHKVSWDASVFPSGMYFYRLKAGEYVQTRKMVLLK